MADARDQLESLRNMLQVRRKQVMEKLARGVDKEESYREHVGRCKELADTIEKIGQQIRNINGGNDDENSGK